MPQGSDKSQPLKARSKPLVSLIVAVSENDVIGVEGRLPWRLPADLRHFKNLTMGKPVLMGRKTYESIGRPLPGRHNIVVTRSLDWTADGVTIVHSIEDGIKAAADANELMIIGGGEIYARTVSFADRVYLTRVHQRVDGDTAFPVLSPENWTCIARDDHPAEGTRPAFSFLSYGRKKP